MNPFNQPSVPCDSPAAEIGFPGGGASQAYQGLGKYAGRSPIYAEDNPKTVRISDSLEGLGKDLAVLHETIEILRGRLEPICSSRPPENQGSVGNTMGSASSIVNRIRDLSLGVNILRANIQDTLNRLEV